LQAHGMGILAQARQGKLFFIRYLSDHLAFFIFKP
jgi:hypothetical protein